MRGIALVLAAAFALAAGPALSSCYKAASTSSNIAVSCKNFSLASDGGLSADCNKAANTTSSTSIDLDDYLGNNLGALVWDGTDFSENCWSLSVSAWCFVSPAWVSVAATCSDGSQHSGATSSYKISDKIENSSGSFDVPE